jgi:flagellar motor switch protein FliN/FliY
MSETENFLKESGKEFQAAANAMFKAFIDSQNTLCGGRLSFGEPTIAAAMPAGLSAPYVVAACECTGDAAGRFAFVADVASARAMATLLPGAGAGPDEMDAFKELASNACSAVGAALRNTLSLSASTSLKETKTAANAEALLDMLGGENIFIAANGRIADMQKPLLLACGADLRRTMFRAAPTPKPPLPKNVERILKIPVPVIVVVAEKRLPFRDVLDLTEGTVLEFDKSSSEPLMLLVNDRKVGLGRVVKVGERFGLRIEEIGGPEDIVQKLH